MLRTSLGTCHGRHGTRHQDCVSAVNAYIQERCLEDITLVGHSFAGPVVQKLAGEVNPWRARSGSNCQRSRIKSTWTAST